MVTKEVRAPAPNITALAPNDDSILGGATVAITGSRLAGATGVMFGTVPATDFVGNSDTSVTATAPPQDSPGLVDVTVTTPNGTSNGLQFNYSGASAPAGTVIPAAVGYEVFDPNNDDTPPKDVIAWLVTALGANNITTPLTTEGDAPAGWILRSRHGLVSAP